MPHSSKRHHRPHSIYNLYLFKKSKEEKYSGYPPATYQAVLYYKSRFYHQLLYHNRIFYQTPRAQPLFMMPLPLSSVWYLLQTIVREF